MVTRSEKVELELVDRFTTPMLKAAAAAALLDKNLDHLSDSAVESARGQEKVSKSTKEVGDQAEKTSKKTKEYTLEMAKADEAASRLRKSLREQASAALDAEQGIDRNSDALRDGSNEIDKYSGRLRLLAEAAVFLGPALVPIGAVAVPATIAFAGGLAAAASSVGIAILAFHGLGDSLDALNAYQLEPTQANLEKMQAEMAALGPAGSEFVHFLDALQPQMESIQELSRLGLFPGVEKGVASLLTMLPEVQQIIFSISREMGKLAAEAGTSLAGPDFEAFFDYLQTDAAPTLEAFSHSIGNVIEGLASVIVAFAPLSRDFSSGMESMTQSFADWAAGLSETDGFRSFVAYVRESGPQVLALLGSLASAFVDIASAAAPVGSVVLDALTALAKVLSVIADSPIGPPLFTGAAAMLALSRATLIANAAMVGFSGSTAAGVANVAKLKGALSFAAILAGIWAVDKAMDAVFGDRSVDADNLLKNLTNLDTSHAATELDKIGVSIMNINSSLSQGTDKVFGFLPGDTTFSEAKDNIDKVDQALAQLVEGGNPEQAAAAMDKIVASAHEQGISTEEATKWFKLYNEALGNSEAADRATGAQERYANALRASGRVNQLTRAQIEALNESMEEQTSAALGAFDAVTQYARALDEAQKRAKHTNAGIDENTKAGQKNRDVLSQLAGAWNNQGDAVRNNMGKWQAARGEFIAVAKQMGVTGAEARALADRILEIPKQRQIDIKLYGSKEAASEIERIRAAVTSIPREWSTTYYVNQVNRINKPSALPGNPDGSADGGTVPTTGLGYADRHHYLLADGEEVISNRHGQADRHRSLLKAINAGRLADGGTAGGGRRTLDDQLAIAQILQQIQGYRQSLNKDGKDRLEGLNRRVAELQLRAAQKELRLAEHREEREARQEARDKAKEQRDKFTAKRDTLSGIASGFSFDSLLPSQPQTVAQGVAAEIADFKSQILDAGGVWTKAMRGWASDMVKAARDYDKVTEQIALEEQKRDDLTKTLAEQQNQLDQLNSTMASYSASVANNFLRNPFGGARTDTVAGAPGAATAALASAQAQLAELRQSSAGDSVALAAQAAELIARIKDLQASADAEVQDTTVEVSGLQALRETLVGDTASANRMAAALKALSDKGLDTTGDLGGLYQQLAASGDVATAEELANLSAEQIDEYEKLFAAREDAAALVASQATQAVYGEQQAQLMDQIAQTTAAITSLDAGLAILNATQAVLGEQVRLGAQSGIALLQPQIGALTFAIGTLAAQFAEQKKKDKV